MKVEPYPLYYVRPTIEHKVCRRCRGTIRTFPRRYKIKGYNNSLFVSICVSCGNCPTRCICK